MSLTKQDLSDIRYVVLDALDVAVNPRLDSLEEDVSSLKSDVSYLKNDMREVKDSLHNLDGRVEALEADIKEIYIMLSSQQNALPSDKEFNKLKLKDKLLKLNKQLLQTAKEAGIDLPR